MTAAPTIENAAAYFDTLASTFTRAAEKSGSTVRETVSPAGHAARLHFAGQALAPRILPALAHLTNDKQQPELLIYLFDSVSTQTPFVYPSAEVQSAFQAKEMWLYADATRHILLDPHANTLTMLDREQRRGYFWTEDAERLIYHETSFPLRLLWHWWLQPYGLQLTHAGAVANKNGAVIIAGASGAGKSTVALACLDSSLLYLGDDFILTHADPAPRVHSLYCSAKLHPHHWQRFPHLAQQAKNGERLNVEKVLLFVNESFADKIQLNAPARALLIPRVVGTGSTRIKPVSNASALREMAVSTLFLLFGSGAPEFELLAQFTQQLPCFCIELGDDLTEIPQVIGELLETL